MIPIQSGARWRALCVNALVAGTPSESEASGRLCDGEALSAASIRPLLFKGVSLAYSHYSKPHLPPRCDTDMMVRHGAYRRSVLRLLGWDFIRRLELAGI